MSFLRYSAAFLFFVLFASGAVSAVDVKKALGDEVSFSPASAIPTGASIIWKHRSDSGVVIKVIEYDEDGEKILNQIFQGITTLDTKTGKITIKNLTNAHKGVYTIDINSKEQEQKFTLTFMERVPKPVIKPEKIPNNADVMYLRCEYSETIIWRNSDGETLKGSAISPIGESITVHRERKPDKSYTCTLKNEVSEETSEPAYERDLFKDEGSSSISAIICALISIFIAAILIIPIVLYNFWGRCRKVADDNLKKKACIGALLPHLYCRNGEDECKEVNEEKGKEQGGDRIDLENDKEQVSSALLQNQTQDGAEGDQKDSTKTEATSAQ